MVIKIITKKYILFYIRTYIYIYTYIINVYIYICNVYVHIYIYIYQSHGSFARMVVRMVNRSILPSTPKKKQVVFLFGHTCGDNF